MNEKTINFNLDQLETIVNDLYLLKNKCTVYTFSGPLGAGKTTLVKALLKSFGVTAPVTSPTFSYLNVYENSKGELLYHFDLYRLKTLQEFLEMGFDEYLYLENSWTFIEWPEIIVPLITHKACLISLDFGKSNDERQLRYKTLG